MQTTMRKWIVMSVAIIGFICCNPYNSQAQKPDFSGTWSVNTEKSDFSGCSDPSLVLCTQIARTIKISQTANHILLQPSYDTLPGGGGLLFPAVDSLPMNGNGEEVSLANGGLKITRTLQWSADNKKATVLSKYKFEINGAPSEYTTTENYFFADGGNALILEKEIVTSEGTTKLKAAYAKL